MVALYLGRVPWTIQCNLLRLEWTLVCVLRSFYFRSNWLHLELCSSGRNMLLLLLQSAGLCSWWWENTRSQMVFLVRLSWHACIGVSQLSKRLLPLLSLTFKLQLRMLGDRYYVATSSNNNNMSVFLLCWFHNPTFQYLRLLFFRHKCIEQGAAGRSVIATMCLVIGVLASIWPNITFNVWYSEVTCLIFFCEKVILTLTSAGTSKWVPVLHLQQLRISAPLLGAHTNRDARVYSLNIAYADCFIEKGFYYQE